MLHVSQVRTEAQSPQAQMMQMATAHWVSRLLYVAAQVRIADHLWEKAKTADELAGPTQTHAPSLYRLMRALAGLGVLIENDAHCFSLTPLGSTLRVGTPDSVRSAVLTLAGDMFTKSLDQLHYSVETGKTAFEKVFGVPLFAWLANHSAEASMFSETMVRFHGDEPAAVAAAYDFSRYETIIDVGGATGNLLAAILGRHAKPHGILFDLPHVVGDAAPLLLSRGLKDRVGIEAGNFFENVPAGGDAYLLSHIIHDWKEEQCLAILGNCRRAMSRSGQLLIIETILPAGNTPHLGKMLDIIMLAIPGGQERTESEYSELLGKAGFQLQRVAATKSAVSIIEARPL
jgi:O-methyltransferase domain/Dimerisation domain